MDFLTDHSSLCDYNIYIRSPFRQQSTKNNTKPLILFSFTFYLAEDIVVCYIVLQDCYSFKKSKWRDESLVKHINCVNKSLCFGFFLLPKYSLLVRKTPWISNFLTEYLSSIILVVKVFPISNNSHLCLTILSRSLLSRVTRVIILLESNIVRYLSFHI